MSCNTTVAMAEPANPFLPPDTSSATPPAGTTSGDHSQPSNPNPSGLPSANPTMPSSTLPGSQPLPGSNPNRNVGGKALTIPSTIPSMQGANPNMPGVGQPNGSLSPKPETPKVEDPPKPVEPVEKPLPEGATYVGKFNKQFVYKKDKKHYFRAKKEVALAQNGAGGAGMGAGNQPSGILGMGGAGASNSNGPGQGTGPLNTIASNQVGVAADKLIDQAKGVASANKQYSGGHAGKFASSVDEIKTTGVNVTGFMPDSSVTTGTWKLSPSNVISISVTNPAVCLAIAKKAKSVDESAQSASPTINSKLLFDCAGAGSSFNFELNGAMN